MPRLLGRRVERLSGEAGEFLLGTDRGDEVRCKAVVVAAGAGAFGPNRPPLDGIERVRGAARCSTWCAGATTSAASGW